MYVHFCFFFMSEDDEEELMIAFGFASSTYILLAILRRKQNDDCKPVFRQEETKACNPGNWRLWFSRLRGDLLWRIEMVIGKVVLAIE